MMSGVLANPNMISFSSFAHQLYGMKPASMSWYEYNALPNGVASAREAKITSHIWTHRRQPTTVPSRKTDQHVPTTAYDAAATAIYWNGCSQ